MINLVNGFAKRGIFIDLVVIKAKGSYINFVSEKVKLVDLFSQSFSYRYISKSRIFQYLKYIIAIPLLIKYLRKRNIHILITTLHLSNFIALVVKKYFVKDVKLIVRIANTLSVESSKIMDWKTRLLTKMVRLLLPVADAIIANSQGPAEDIKRHISIPSHSVHVIYNPIVSPAIVKQAAEPLSHSWFDDPGYHIILSVNRLCPQKDLPTLLRAFAETIKSVPSSRLIILGDGPDRHKLESLTSQLGVRAFVDFVRFQPNPFPWMAKAHVLVLSSLFEGCPNVLIESMACGTPVISTDCQSGPREILQGGELGKLVPVGNYQELSVAIVETLQKSVSSGLLKKRASEFSIESSLECYSHLLKSMML